MASEAPAPDVVAVEFAVTDPVYPFVRLSAAENCRVRLQTMLPRDAGRFAEFFEVRGADPDRILDACAGRGLGVTLLSRTEDGGRFEFVVEGACPAMDLAAQGAIPVEVESESGEGRIVAEIPSHADPSSVVATVTEEHDAIELVSKRGTDSLSSLFTHSELQQTVRNRLTDRQREVLETAYDAGFYDHGTDCTVASLGDRLGISSSTVSQHLAAAERELVSVVFDQRVLEG